MTRPTTAQSTLGQAKSRNEAIRNFRSANQRNQAGQSQQPLLSEESPNRPAGFATVKSPQNADQNQFSQFGRRNAQNYLTQQSKPPTPTGADSMVYDGRPL